MADQYKYDYEKKKWIKVSSSTPSRGETNRNGRSSTTSTNKSSSTTNGNLSSIPAALHNNDRDTYMRLLEENNLTPRFARFVDHPNYMKLVNETRQSVTTSQPVQPIFDTDAAIDALQNMANNGGYYVPIGGSEQRMYELANEFAEKVNRGEYQESASESEFADDSDTKFSMRVTDQKTLDFLENQDTVTTYKTMQVVDGKLYPPMAAVVAGQYEDASQLGTWEQATERPDLIKLDKKGKPQFTLNKGKGKGSLAAAYNPYMHSSNLVLNDQFSGAYDRPNLVTVECEVPVSELTSGYHAQYAKDSVGWHAWHTGTVAGALRRKTGIERQVLLSRWIKPVRIVPDKEVAQMYKELLDGTGIAVPDNVVPPALLRELKNAGVEIAVSGRVPDDGVKYSARDNQIETPEFRRWFKGSWVVNPDGSPKVMYHGTSRYGFDSFDTYGGRYGLMGMGSYFTDNAEVAEGYTKNGRGSNPGVYEVYLSVKNPIDMDAKAGSKLARAWEEYFNEYLPSDSKINGDMTNEQILRVVEEALRYDEYMTVSEVAELFDGFYRSQGFDGITHIGGGRFHAGNGVRHRVVIAFEPEQVKSATDNIGTFDPEDANIYHQLRDPDQVSDRELLANVMDSAAETQAELDFVRRYRKQIEQLDQKQLELEQVAQEIIQARKNKARKSDIRLLNMSATKDLTKNATNAIVIRSIFDVYTAHMSDMAKYNALGLQILDAMKWLNYVERTDEVDKNGEKTGKIKTRSVRKSLENAYGAEARRYIVSFIRNLNGDVEAGLEDDIFNRITSNYKIAAVGANLRVGMLQITSMPRAATVIDPKYLMAGLAKWNARRGKTSKQAIEKVGIAKWKSMGFYDTNISRNLRQMIKHDETTIDKVREGSMKLAEWGDAWTMGVLYGAVESELLHTEKKLAPGTEAWDKRVNERMREIIYRTQVVDSTMTRSHLMRQKGAISGALAFMSEPTLTLNMLNDAIFKVRMDARQGKKWNPATAKTVAKVMAVTATVNVFAAVVEALFSALRDDDEFEEFSEKYLTALFGDYSDAETFGDRLSAFMSGSYGSKLNLLDNIPVVSDIIDAAKSGAADQMWQAFAGEIGEGYRAMMKVMREGGSLADYYRAVYKLMGGASKAVGLPVSNAMRDVVSVYNTIVAEPMGWRRLQTYENTNSEAAAALLEAQIAGDDKKTSKVRERIAAYNMDQAKIAQALAKQAEEAYAMGRIDRSEAEAYMTGDGGKRSRQVKEALLETDYEIETGLEYGNMKADFISGVLSESDARKYLKKYDGLRDKEIDERIKQWQYEKSTGLSYGNMKRDYIDGELTDSEVKSYRMKYGDADEAAVETLLGEWQYEKDTGLLWSELKLDYADGVISESKLRDYLKVYGGQSEEEVDTTVLKYDYYTVYGTSEGYSKAWRIPHAYETGGDYGAYIDEAFQEYMYGGDKPSTWKQARGWLASSLAGYYKPRYLPIAGTPEGDILLEEILDVYVAAGWERDYQRKYIAEKWIED